MATEAAQDSGAQVAAIQPAVADGGASQAEFEFGGEDGLESLFPDGAGNTEDAHDAAVGQVVKPRAVAKRKADTKKAQRASPAATRNVVGKDTSFAKVVRKSAQRQASQRTK